MQAQHSTANVVRFGIFQLDLKAHELHKAGIKIKLQEQPFRVLALLVERAGEVVTREELRQQVWPTDVYVAFDQGLNNAIRKVRDALEDSAETPRFIETLPRHGYRFIAPVGDPAADAPAGASPLPSSAPRSGSGSGMLRIGLIGLIAVAIFAALTYWTRQGSHVRAGSESEKVVLAVLPFDNLSGDPNQEFFSDGLTEEMIIQLGKLNPERLIVIGRSSAAKYKGSSVPASQIGRELNADYLVQGSVRRSSDHVRITVQLTQARNETDLWTDSYDSELKDVLVLQDSVTRMIANQIHIALVPRQLAQSPSQRSLDPEAHDAYLKGRYCWNKRTAEGMQKALDYFQQAINKDPTYGEAYSGLADSNSGLAWHGFLSPAEALPKAEAAARKAIEINPQSAEAHASLALVLHHMWGKPGAEAEFKRALQLNPRYANAHHWYGDYLSVRGRHEEAILEANQALELDPLNLMIGTWVGLRHYLARRYDRAIDQGRATVSLDPSFAAAHLMLGETYVQSGQQKQGLAELQNAASLSGNSPLYLAQVAVAYAASGRKAEALEMIARLQTLSRTRYVSPYGMAQIYAALKDEEQTFKWLHMAYDDRAVWMTYLAVDPVFDPFRSDQRFQGFLERVRLLP